GTERRFEWQSEVKSGLRSCRRFSRAAILRLNASFPRTDLVQRVAIPTPIPRILLHARHAHSSILASRNIHVRPRIHGVELHAAASRATAILRRDWNVV